MWTWHAKNFNSTFHIFPFMFYFWNSLSSIVVSINVSKSFKSIFAHRHLYSRKTEDLLPSETMIPLWTMLFLWHQQCHTGCDQGVGATSALSNQLEPRATTEVLLFATIPQLQQLFTSLNSILVISENWKRCSSIRVAEVGSLSANAKKATKWSVYAIFAKNSSFLRIIANLQI